MHVRRRRSTCNQLGLLQLEAARYADLSKLAGCACGSRVRQCILKQCRAGPFTVLDIMYECWGLLCLRVLSGRLCRLCVHVKSKLGWQVLLFVRKVVLLHSGKVWRC